MESIDKKLQEYLNCISAYDKEFKSWSSHVDKLLKRYRDERKGTNTAAKFNILWSNVQTLVPATFSKLPVPDVSRRFRDNDPVGRVASLILERALDFEIQHYSDYRTALKMAVYDRFLGGRGTIWARYEPHFQMMDVPDDGLQITEDTDEAPMDEQLDYECAPIDYVHWKDFGHDVARTWEEVTKVWRKVYMNEDAVIDRFGKQKAKTVNYDKAPEDLKMQADNRKQACIIELWDKSTGKVVWIARGLKEFLDERDDPLKLQDFFPCPKPLYATLTNNSLIPVTDFSLYQDQAIELDTLSDRIGQLADMLQVKGVYDDAFPPLARLFTEGTNGNLLPIKNYAAFAEKGGLAGGIDVVDLTPIYNALKEAYAAMDQAKMQVYEITGISDIIRGQGNANETATAQRIKGQYASLRLKSMQEDVALFATECLRLKAQIMCAKFQPRTLLAMAAVEQLSPVDQQMIQPALELLLGQARMTDPMADTPNPLRSFRIDIEADSLVEIDEMQEKADRIEMLTAVGGFLEKGLPVIQAAPQAGPLIVELLKFAVTAFKAGKTIEGTIDQALEQMKQAASQPKPPDPEQQKAEMEMEAKKQEIQANQQDKQMDMQIKQVENQGRTISAQADVIKSQTELQKAEIQAQNPWGVQ